MKETGRRTIHYLLGFVLAGAGLWIAQAAGLHLGERFTLLYLAVFLSVYLLGVGPSVLTAAVSIVEVLASSSPEIYQPGGKLRLFIQSVVFALTSALVIYFHWRTQKAENEAQVGREELRSFFDSASAGMSQTDPPTGRILRINRAFCQMLGYEPREMLGRRFLDFTHPDDCARSWKGYQDLVTGSIPEYREEKRYIRKDGSVVWADIMVNLVRDSEGRPLRSSAVALDATERKGLEEALRESQANLNQAQTVARVGSWQMDLAHDLATWSDEMYRIFGLPVGTPVTSEKFLSIVHDEDRSNLKARWKEAVHHGGSLDFQHRVKVGQEIKWIRERADFKRDSNGEMMRGIGTSQDITDFKRAEDAMQAARFAAEEANRMKDLFLATLSHELRTPLTAILSWAQLLRRGKLDADKSKTGLRVIEESARAQTQLIDDLMDVSRIITGKLAVTLEAVDLVEVLRSALDSIRLMAEKKSILIRESLGDVPLMIRADRARMKQVFWNLLSNAVKFTPAGGKVDLIASASSLGEGNVAVIKIQDNGKGIPPHFLPHLFDRFSQADLSSVRVHGGLGLGLALVKSLLDLQNGLVEAESPGEGKGATFTVELPLIGEFLPARREHPEQTSGRVLRDTLPDLSGIEILLIDDDKATLEALTEALVSVGAKVRTGSSATEAMKQLQTHRPSLIISDIAMPGEDGYALIKKIRSLDPSRGGLTPAIALTAYAGADHRKKALDEGFQKCVNKPIDTGLLANTVLETIRGRRLEPPCP